MFMVGTGSSKSGQAIYKWPIKRGLQSNMTTYAVPLISLPECSKERKKECAASASKATSRGTPQERFREVSQGIFDRSGASFRRLATTSREQLKASGNTLP
jgi:hypothetical protein